MNINRRDCIKPLSSLFVLPGNLIEIPIKDDNLFHWHLIDIQTVYSMENLFAIDDLKPFPIKENISNIIKIKGWQYSTYLEFEFSNNNQTWIDKRIIPTTDQYNLFVKSNNKTYNLQDSKLSMFNFFNLNKIDELFLIVENKTVIFKNLILQESNCKPMKEFDNI